MSRKMVPIVFDNEDLEFISKVLKEHRDGLMKQQNNFFSKDDKKIKYCEDLIDFIKEYLYIYKDRED